MSRDLNLLVVDTVLGSDITLVYSNYVPAQVSKHIDCLDFNAVSEDRLSEGGSSTTRLWSEIGDCLCASIRVNLRLSVWRPGITLVHNHLSVH